MARVANVQEGVIRGFRGIPKDEFKKRLGSGDDNLLSWVLTTPIGVAAFQSWRRGSNGKVAPSSADGT